MDASGEKLLTVLLQPDASAKFPIIEWMGTNSPRYNEVVPTKINNVNKSANDTSNTASYQNDNCRIYSLNGIKVSFIYGAPTHDWMNVEAGKKMLEVLVKEEGCIDGGLHILDHCGHSVNLDEPINFAKLVNRITE